MKRYFALRALAAAGALVIAVPGEAHAIAHIEGGGVFTDGSLAYSADMGPDFAGAQTAELHATGLGATWHFVYADAISWECSFDLNTDLGTVETAAAGAGTAVGGCIGTPLGIILPAPGNVEIECPLIGPTAYARVGTTITVAGVCWNQWGAVGDFSDVTITLALAPVADGDPTTVQDFDVVGGEMRFRG